MVTYCSMLCALWSLFNIFIRNNVSFLIFLVILSAIFDALDGRIARFLKVDGRFGVELDSLADFLSFGVTPAMIFFYSFNWSNEMSAFAIITIFPICMALRLAKFNVNAVNCNVNDKIKRFKKNFFFGLAAPVGAFTLLLPIIADILGYVTFFTSQEYVLCYAFVVASFLIIPFPTFSHKVLHVGFDNINDIIFTFILTILFVFFILYPIKLVFYLTIGYIATIPISIVFFKKKIKKLKKDRHDNDFKNKKANDAGKKKQISK